MLNNIKTVQKDKGFTIVELLIVIVVIGILAAITMVAYGNITTQANTNAAKANAANVAKVAEAYNADDTITTSGYPTQAQIVAYGGTAGNISRVPTGITVSATNPTATNGKTTVGYAAIGTTGACVSYWNFSTGALGWAFAGAGKLPATPSVSGAATTCA